MLGAIDQEVDRAVLAAAQDALCAGQSQRHTIAATEPVEIFLDVIAPSPEIIAVGGVHIAIALTQLAKVMGYRTTVIDPRGVFGTDARFPYVDRLIHAWPDEALRQINLSRLSAVVMLTHDPKLDDPALKIALAQRSVLRRRAGQSGRHRNNAVNGCRPQVLVKATSPGCTAPSALTWADKPPKKSPSPSWLKSSPSATDALWYTHPVNNT